MKQELKQLVNIPAESFLLNPGTASSNVSIGYFSDDFQIIGSTISLSLYISDPTTISLLEDVDNWSGNGSYIGTAITGTIQNNKHYDSSYFFECVGNNVWIRMPRG